MINFGEPLEANIWYTIRINLSQTLYVEEIISNFKVYTVTKYVNSNKVVKID